MTGHPRLVWRAAAPLTAAGALVVAVPALLLAGPPGLVGALLGAVLVVLFFGPDILLAALAGDRLDPVALALVGYVIKLILLGGLLFAVGGSDAVSGSALAAGVVVCAACWLTGHVRAVSALGKQPADDVVEGA